MDFTLTEEQEAIRDLAARILTEQLPPERLRALEAGGAWFADDVWAELAKAEPARHLPPRGGRRRRVRPHRGVPHRRAGRPHRRARARTCRPSSVRGAAARPSSAPPSSARAPARAHRRHARSSRSALLRAERRRPRRSVPATQRHAHRRRVAARRREVVRRRRRPGRRPSWSRPAPARPTSAVFLVDPDSRGRHPRRRGGASAASRSGPCTLAGVEVAEPTLLGRHRPGRRDRRRGSPTGSSPRSAPRRPACARKRSPSPPATSTPASSSARSSARSRRSATGSPTPTSTPRASGSPRCRPSGGSTPASTPPTSSWWPSTGRPRAPSASCTPPSTCTAASAWTSTTRSTATSDGPRCSSSRSAAPARRCCASGPASSPSPPRLSAATTPPHRHASHALTTHPHTPLPGGTNHVKHSRTRTVDPRASAARRIGLLAQRRHRDRRRRHDHDHRGTGGGDDATALADGGFGDLEAVCQDGDAIRGDRRLASPTPQITVGTMTDKGGVVPGPQRGDVRHGGRVHQVVQRARRHHRPASSCSSDVDAKLFEYEPAVTEACGRDFALVGGGAVFDEDPNGVRVGCDLPNIAGLRRVGARAATADLQVQPIPNPLDKIAIGRYQRRQARLPGRHRAATAIMASAIASVLLVQDQLDRGGEVPRLQRRLPVDYADPGRDGLGQLRRRDAAEGHQDPGVRRAAAEPRSSSTSADGHRRLAPRRHPAQRQLLRRPYRRGGADTAGQPLHPVGLPPVRAGRRTTRPRRTTWTSWSSTTRAARSPCLGAQGLSSWLLFATGRHRVRLRPHGGLPA